MSPEVGKEFSEFPEPVGPVLAIVESTHLVTIHTQLRGGLSASPILLSPDAVTERVFSTTILLVLDQPIKIAQRQTHLTLS